MDSQTCDDETYMRRALELAQAGYGQTAPNPLVGAVVVGGGRVLGEGVHRAAGLPHAETEALDEAGAWLDATSSNGSRDLTLYVNLEPCCHQGLTPPCADAIVQSRVGRVVAAIVDPDPRVAGKGLARLRDAGVQVECGCLKNEATELNHVFIARQRRQRPFVALKVALSADGCVAAADGSPVRITGDAAQRHTHWLRAGCDAILIGVETLVRDRPRLDRRLYEGSATGPPTRIVIDPRLRSEPEWLWEDAAPTLLVCDAGAFAEAGARAARLAECARIVPVAHTGEGLDLQAMLQALESHDVSSLLVEGGGRTHRAFMAAGLWDRMYVYRNPSLVLEGTPWAAAETWSEAQAEAVVREDTTLGEDTLRVHVRRDGDFDHGD